MKFHGTIDFQGDVLVLKSLVLDTGTANIDVIKLLHGAHVTPALLEIHPMKSRPDNIKRATPKNNFTVINMERTQHD